jgi:hypothetical protein
MIWEMFIAAEVVIVQLYHIDTISSENDVQHRPALRHDGSLS